jgi:hypothetical protein
MDAIIKFGEKNGVRNDCLLRAVKRINVQMEADEKYKDSKLDKWVEN